MEPDRTITREAGSQSDVAATRKGTRASNGSAKSLGEGASSSRRLARKSCVSTPFSITVSIPRILGDPIAVAGQTGARTKALSGQTSGDKIGLKKYAIYVQDYGAPVGYRLAVKHPDRITAIIVQNGNAYDEGVDNDFWKPIKEVWKDPKSKEKRDALRKVLTYDATKWQYTDGAKDPELVSPDGAAEDQYLLDRKGNDEIQLDLFRSYGTNPPLYPSWQAYFRKYQPPMLIVWGKNDKIFPPAGAEPYKRDLKNLDFHLIDAGHFALETNGDEIAQLMHAFLDKQVAKK